jgi:DNA-binding transcriptional MerR regulator
MSGTETPYTSKEIIARLSIGDSTLRKWCLALEEQNYNFIRTEQNKRMFTEKDSYVLTQFKHLVKDKNMSISNAAAIVASKYENEVFSGETEIEQVNDDPFALAFPNETLGELKSEIEQLKDMNRMLLSRLDEQQKYIESRLDQHDSILMNSLRESQQTKQLLLEAKEREQEKKPRKGIFRFFTKE